MVEIMHSQTARPFFVHNNTPSVEGVTYIHIPVPASCSEPGWIHPGVHNGSFERASQELAVDSQELALDN